MLFIEKLKMMGENGSAGIVMRYNCKIVKSIDKKSILWNIFTENYRKNDQITLDM